MTDTPIYDGLFDECSRNWYYWEALWPRFMRVIRGGAAHE